MKRQQNKFEVEPLNIKMCLNIFTKFKCETIQIVTILLIYISIFFTSDPPFSTCVTSNIPRTAKNCRFYCSMSQIWTLQHSSTSLKLLKLRNITDIYLPAIFLRGSHMGPICILQIMEILVTENKTEHYIIGYLFASILLK